MLFFGKCYIFKGVSCNSYFCMKVNIFVLISKKCFVCIFEDYIFIDSIGMFKC